MTSTKPEGILANPAGRFAPQSPLHVTAGMGVVLVRLAAVLAALLGIVVFAGWLFDLPLLRSVLSGAVEMKANTAVALVLAGIALYVLGGRPSPALQRFSLALALVVGALGCATLGQYLFGWQLGIDELLFRDTARAYNVFRGRMSPYSAVAFAGLGLALAVLPQPRLRPLVWLAALAVMAIGGVSFLGYAWKASELVTDLWLPPVALHTAFAFILLGSGTLLAGHAPGRTRAAAPLLPSLLPPFLPNIPVETRILAGFIGAIVLLFVAGGFTYRAGHEFANSAHWVTHAQAVRAALGRLYATISDAESAQRNYLLTGNPAFKAAYTRTLPKLDEQEDELVRLVVDNPAQQQQLAELLPFIPQRIDALERHIAIFERQDMAAVRAAIGGDIGIAAKNEIGRLVERMDDTEKQLLVAREASLKRSRELTLITLLTTVAAATGFLVLLYGGIRRQMAARSEAEQALVAARDAADIANRAKSTFLATMSHEIRTPMNGVLGMLELLGMTKLEAEQRHTLDIVQESAKSLLRIIDGILDFSQIEAGKLEIRPETVALGEVIEAVRNIYAGNASSKGLLIKLSVDAKISAAVRVDPLRLRQILNNFVSNAIKFTAEGTIEIKAKLIGRANGEDRVRFSVTDTGIGIAVANQRRLFQPFSQAESDTTRRYGGTGLGLAICQRLAETMGGSIELLSAPGKGTTMMLTLSLPIVDVADLPKADPQARRDALGAALGTRRAAPSVAQAEAERTLVLLVDDHPTNRLLLMRQVHALGYAAESAENGVEALAMWQSGRFALLITDCNMPEMDGHALASNIRRLESANGGKRAPIIACTANALSGEVEACFAAGMDDYLAKPVKLMQLLKKLDHWLPLPRNAPAVDQSLLASISGGDATIEREILDDFRRVNDADVALLKQAVADIDLPRVGQAAHRIKGASLMIGSLALAGMCERIEQASRSNDWKTVEASLGAFDEELMRLNAYFDSL